MHGMHTPVFYIVNYLHVIMYIGLYRHIIIYVIQHYDVLKCVECIYICMCMCMCICICICMYVWLYVYVSVCVKMYLMYIDICVHNTNIMPDLDNIYQSYQNTVPIISPQPLYPHVSGTTMMRAWTHLGRGPVGGTDGSIAVGPQPTLRFSAAAAWLSGFCDRPWCHGGK